VRTLRYLAICAMAIGFLSYASKSSAQLSHNFINLVFEYAGYGGSGAQGALTAGNIGRTATFINSSRTYLTAATTAGSTTALTVDCGGVNCNAMASPITTGDEIIIIQMFGANAGMNDIRSVSATGVNSITVSTAVSKAFPAYSAGTASTSIVKIEQYTTVTVNSGSFLTTNVFNGQTGGVMIFRTTGAVTVNDGAPVAGRISMGYFTYNNVTWGAYTYHAKGYLGRNNANGDSYMGTSAGANGTTSATNKSPGGIILAGKSNVDGDGRIFPGSGGGGAATGTGGNGGGVIIIKSAGDININNGAAIDATGSPGSTAGGAGAGGAGGSIYLSAPNITYSVTGCGSVGASGGAGAGGGAQGDGGMIYINYSTADPCPSNATASGATAGTINRRRFYTK
jgi:hypothetical protein